jgi:hypothetical protein
VCVRVSKQLKQNKIMGDHTSQFSKSIGFTLCGMVLR